jgi:hypothetical protein
VEVNAVEAPAAIDAGVMVAVTTASPRVSDSATIFGPGLDMIFSY